jgi:glycosyltransferase involved in cell wall biosynthesis
LKILVVHEVDYLEKVIYEIHEFPEMLASAGHEVTFFQFQEGADRSKKNKFREREISGRVYSDARIKLVGPHQFGIPAVDRLWATLSSWPALYKVFREGRFDVVLNFAVPTYGLQVLAIAKSFGVPVVHRALDVSHEIRESIYRLPILAVEKILYRLVGTLSANNEAMMAYCKRLSGRKKPSYVNYPPLDLLHFSSSTPNDKTLRDELDIKEQDKVITYMGSFFYFSGLPECIHEFAKSLEGDKGLKLLLIGGGEQDKELRGLVKSLGLAERVIFTGFIPYADLPRYLKLSSVAINPLKISQVAAVAFPHKVLQYLASGLAVVSTRLDGLVSAIDGVEGLHWEVSPEACIQKAVSVIRAQNNWQQPESVQAKLNQLFAPEAALESLMKTLQLAIGARASK